MVAQTVAGKFLCVLLMLIGVVSLGKMADSLANYLMVSKRIRHENEMMDRLLGTHEQVTPKYHVYFFLLSFYLFCYNTPLQYQTK